MKKEQISITISEAVLKREFKHRRKGQSRSQNIEDMIVAHMDRLEKEKKGVQEDA